MKTDFFPGINLFPAFIEEEERKTCYLLGKDGSLLQFQEKDDRWSLLSPYSGRQTFKGFEALVDNRGKHILVAFDERGTLFLLQLEEVDRAPEAFCRKTGTEVIQLSACLDLQNILHLLQLSAIRGEKACSLVYHRYEQNKWTADVILEWSPGNVQPFALIVQGKGGSLFALYSTCEDGLCRPVLRELKKRQIGKTISFPEKWENPLLPSVCLAGDKLHISMLSRIRDSLFLNYACLSDEKWENILIQEVSPFTLTPAPLYLRGKELLLTWGKQNTIFFLFSGDGGKSWERTGALPRGQYLRLIRYLASPDKQYLNGKWKGDYFFARGSPPVHLVKPEEMLSYGDETVPFEQEFKTLDRLYSSLAVRAGQMHSVNLDLQNKLAKKEQEFSRLYARSISQTRELEEHYKSKISEFEKAAATFKSIIKELQSQIKKEKKLQEEKQQNQSLEISRLKEEIKKLQDKISSQEETIRQLKEKNLFLEQKNEELQKKRVHFFQRIFKGFRPL